MKDETELGMTDERELVDSELGILDLLVALVENARALIGIPVISAIAAFALSFLVPPTFTATTRLLPPQQAQSAAATVLASQLGAFAGGVGAALGIKNPTDLYVGMLKSRTVANKLIERFNLREVYEEKYDDDVRKELARRTHISTGKEGLITIDVDDHDAKRAAQIANGYVRALDELTQTLAITEAAQRRLFFGRQLRETKDDLARSEIALRASGINEATLKTVPQSALESLARLKAQITAQEVKLGAMRGFMTESNPDYRQAQQELAALRAQLAKAEEIDPSKGGGAGAAYISKYRDFKYYEALFELMAKQYEIARLDEAREGAVIQVVDEAMPPERKSRPNRALIAAFTGAATFILMAALVALRKAVANAANEPRFGNKLRTLRKLLEW